MIKREIIDKLGERKKMFEDYLELVRRQPRLKVNKDRPYASIHPEKPGGTLKTFQ